MRVAESYELFISNCRKTSWLSAQLRNHPRSPVTGIRSAAGSGGPSGHRSQVAVRVVNARDVDDGLPGGLLIGAIEQVWVALHHDWA